MPASQATQQQPDAHEAPRQSELPAGEQLSIQEMTRIMDVAATLRKERATVEQQLNIEEVKATLRERLLEAAKVSGDPVTAAEIDAAVDQYYDRLHEFQEPRASFATFLAHLWVLRTRIFKWLVGILGVIAAVIAFGMVRDARDASLANSLYEQSLKDEQAIVAWDEGKALETELESKLAAARDALERRDFAALNAIKSELASLRSEFDIQYDVAILNNPGERSVTERIWNDEQGSRTSGFFALVAARDNEGRPVEVAVQDRESDRTMRVNRWGEQVPEPVFNRLMADKQADGVLDEREFGVKRRGTRQLEVTLKGEDGQPIRRGGQITTW